MAITATIIPKSDADQIIYDYYTHEYQENEFIKKISNDIKYKALDGKTELVEPIPNDFPEESLNDTLHAINDAGYTDVDVNEDVSPMTITIKWGDSSIMTIANM